MLKALPNLDRSKGSFSQSNASKFYQLKQSISTFKQKGIFISLYFIQLKSLWDELSFIISITPYICGNVKSTVDQQTQDHALEFLLGLHRYF